MDFKNILGESAPIVISSFLSRDNIIPVLVLLIVLKLLKYGYCLILASKPLERTKTQLDERGKPVTTIEKFREVIK
jgi:hypothetical protein